MSKGTVADRSEREKIFATACFKNQISVDDDSSQEFACFICGMTFAFNSLLSEHIGLKHSVDGTLKVVSTARKRPQKVVCEVCGLTLPSAFSLKGHMSQCHETAI